MTDPARRVSAKFILDMEKAENILNKAFKNRYIGSEDHPVFKNAGSVLETNFQKKTMKGIIKS